MALERIKRRSKKARKRLLKQCCTRMDERPREFYPNLDESQF